MALRAFATMVSRVVPLLLIVSACLIIARVLRDRIARRSESAGRAIFTAIVTATAALSVFVLAQAGCLALARMTEREDAAKLDRWYRAYVGLRGSVTPDMAYDWAMALMVQRRWEDARAMLLRSGTPSPRGMRYDADTVLLIGETFFYSGDLKRASQALAVSGRTVYPALRFYLLGRIAETRDDAPAALDLYDRALASNQQFFPAFYHRQRLLMSLGQYDRSRTEIEQMQQRFPDSHNSDWLLLYKAVTTHQVPPPKEFYVVET